MVEIENLFYGTSSFFYLDDDAITTIEGLSAYIIQIALQHSPV
jgi:hypothetical protein